MNIQLKKTFVIASVALAAMLSNTGVSFAAACMTAGAASPEQIQKAKDDPAAVLAGYSTASAMSDAIRTLIASDTSLAASIIAAAGNLSSDALKKGVGEGLGRAAKVCEAPPNPPGLGEEIQEEVAKLDDNNPISVAFQAEVGSTESNTPNTPPPGVATAPGLGGSGEGTGGTGSGGTNSTQTATGTSGASQDSTGLASSGGGSNGGGGSTSDADNSQSGTQT